MNLLGYYNTRTSTFIPIDRYERINAGHGFKQYAINHIIEVFGGTTPADIKLDPRDKDTGKV